MTIVLNRIESYEILEDEKTLRIYTKRCTYTSQELNPTTLNGMYERLTKALEELYRTDLETDARYRGKQTIELYGTWFIRVDGAPK